jgi:LGFP repeat
MTISERMVRASAGLLESRFGRRGFLIRTAVVGSAVATSPLDFALRPQTAYATVCGSDGGACSAGFSVMCCTINGGVNQCPPGTFAGGWWKADNAGLCGGGPRYYIDCQAECTGCSAGCSPFCNSSCWNYGCHCNNNPGTCDNRRVACNVFRYGQCNQQVACSGPVVCRQISCRPPYEWLPCGTASATDDSTTDHTSECLPGWDAIQVHYYGLGGPGSFLGVSWGGEYAVPGGAVETFLGGQIYGGSAGAWSIHGLILDHYRALGGASSFLGLPVTDETPTPDGVGRFNHFVNSGSIYWTPATGAWSIHGAIRGKWANLGWERSFLGYPVTDEHVAPDRIGRANHFSSTRNPHNVDGSIYWTPTTGAWSIHGAIRAKWFSLGTERSVLGYPVTDEHVAPDGIGRANHFSSTRNLHNVDGSIYWTPTTGAHEVHGPIRAKWFSMGTERSCLGYPISDVITVPGRQQSTFQHGTITYDTTSGTVTSSC